MDWIESAARDISTVILLDAFRDEDLPNATHFAEIIRRHAPAWHDKPTSAGLWLATPPSGRSLGIEIETKTLEYYQHNLPEDWKFYGPIPEIPQAKGGAK